MVDSEYLETSWIAELETALVEGCDFGILRNICKGRPVPPHLRAEVWQICLNVSDKGNSISGFDGLYDLPEQSLIREDCQSVVDKLGNEDEDKVSVVSDLEEILTFYSKSRNIKYERDNGWLELLLPMLTLKLQKSDLYNCFYAMMSRYIPRDCQRNGKPFHLFRLLVLYHDPELCSFLDTKKISPDYYCQQWLRSLFSSTCSLDVILIMWDVLLQQADPFLIFFLALVILVNAKEQLMELTGSSRQDIVDVLVTFPNALEAEDIEDFCQLAQYYASKTPQSFRRDYQVPLYGSSLSSHKVEDDVPVAQALCLPVSVNELLQANQLGAGDGVRYFVVDCRPAEQYNSGHLPTAFHLDANLMLQNPEEFATAVDALCATQKQAIAAASAAGGEHLCFVGSGREQEDQYVHMVVANFLQKKFQYVSVARGGFAAIHEALSDDLADGITEHLAKSCIVCNPEAGSITSDTDESEFGAEKKENFFGKLTSVVKSKSAVVKEKMINYIKNEPGPAESRHVTPGDRVGKRYRNLASIFTIGDEEEDDLSGDENAKHELVSLETWKNKPDILHTFECQEVKDNGYLIPSHLMVTAEHLYVLRNSTSQKGMASIQNKRQLATVVKITSKKKCPELITFKYGSNDDEDGLVITDMDRFLIQKAGDATRLIKIQIMKVLDQLDS